VAQARHRRRDVKRAIDRLIGAIEGCAGERLHFDGLEEADVLVALELGKVDVVARVGGRPPAPRMCGEVVIALRVPT